MKIAIIGGGAAGLMAAATMAEASLGVSVVLFEKNSGVGKKLLVTGGGRCNLTTGMADIKEVLKRYPRGSRFLRYAMHNFPPSAVYEWFKDHGIELKTEKDLRVFPVSNNGKDVVRVFENVLYDCGVRVVLNANVKEISMANGGGFLVDGEKFDKVILTTGGRSYSQTGSSGDGYSFAAKLGHTVTPLAPSLHSFVVGEKWVTALKGVAFARCRLRAVGESEHEFTGPFLFTGRGLTGPAVFALSSLAAFEKFSVEMPLKLFIDFVPELSYAEVKEKFLKIFSEHPRKTFLNTLGFFIANSVAVALLGELGVDGSRFNSEFGKNDLNKVIEALKNTKLSIVGSNVGEEFVTAGGVSLSEVNDKTMESKIISGLYFAGEILDIDGFTGGFNLQAAWATGRAAAGNIATLN